ncbi:hypothetical protein ACWG8W_07530 [Citricoccus zhacaiensis]
MSDLVEALQAARESYVREDYASRVKNLFREHLEQLEPEAKIEDTLYFNHSAIPDFKLTWGRGSAGISSRDVFLRSSYAAVVAGKETTQITTGDPVFLSISANLIVEEPGFVMTKADVARVARESDHSLLTDAEAFREMAAPVTDSNPLSAVVRSNFLRGARGLVDEPIAERLRSTGQGTEGNVTDLIRESFFDDAVLRMERTALLVQWALSREAAEDELPRIEGSMSTEELRNVLPWLLDQAVVPKGNAFWKALGSLFTFEQLEELASDLNGYDVTSLVQANLTNWSAKRAYLGLNVPVESGRTQEPHEPVGNGEADDEGTETSGDESTDFTDSWRFDSGTLGLAQGPFMVRVSNSGHKLKARPGSSTPKWSATVDRLGEYAIRSVSVAGIERAFRVDAKESGNIKDDVDRVVESVADTYFVSHVEVLLPGPVHEDQDEGLEPVAVDFGGGIAIANGPIQLGALVRAAANIMGNQQLDDKLRVAQLPEADASSTR